MGCLFLFTLIMDYVHNTSPVFTHISIYVMQHNVSIVLQSHSFVCIHYCELCHLIKILFSSITITLQFDGKVVHHCQVTVWNNLGHQLCNFLAKLFEDGESCPGRAMSTTSNPLYGNTNNLGNTARRIHDRAVVHQLCPSCLHFFRLIPRVGIGQHMDNSQK